MASPVLAEFGVGAGKTAMLQPRNERHRKQLDQKEPSDREAFQLSSAQALPVRSAVGCPYEESDTTQL